jgi:protein-arginine kinase activator protein McsA
VSLPMLRQALQQAITDEDYELASKLRDEIKRREKHNNKV